MIEKLNHHYSLENPATVYDEESLTVLQLVGRTTGKVNEVVEDQNKLREEVPGLITEEVRKNINSGAFDREIDEYTKHVADAYSEAVQELGTEYRASIGLLDKRIDNLIAGNPSGDWEVRDAHLTPFGLTEETLRGSIYSGTMTAVSSAELTGELIQNKIAFLNARDFENGCIAPDGTPTDFNEATRARSRYAMIFPFDVCITSYDNAGQIYVSNLLEEDVLYEWGYCAVIPAHTPVRVMVSLSPNNNDNPMGSHNIVGKNFVISAITDDSDLFIDGTNTLPAKLFEYGMIDAVGKKGNAWGNAVPARLRTRCPVKLDKDLEISSAGGSYIVYTLSGSTYTNTGWITGNTTIPAGTTFQLYIRDNVDADHPTRESICNQFRYRLMDSVNDRNRDAISALAGAKMHFDLENKDSFNRESASNLPTIAHISDVHCDKKRLKNFAEFVKMNSNLIDKYICTGDLVNDPSQFDDMGYFVGNNCYEMLPVIGNHERHGEIGVATSEEAKAFIGDYFSMTADYYTVDIGDDVRLIVLNQFEGASGETCFSYEQIDWFCFQLAKAAHDKKGVVIALHHLSDFPTHNEKRFIQRDRPWVFASAHNNCGPIIEDIVDAFIDGRALDATYTFKATGTSVTFGYDPEGEAGTFLAYLTGHWHGDFCGFLENHPRQLCLGVTAGCLSSSYSPKNYGEEASDLPRIENTKSQDAFNVYSFDVKNRLVKVVRVGSDVNDIMEDRKKTVFTI